MKNDTTVGLTGDHTPKVTEFQKMCTWWFYSGCAMLALWAVLIQMFYPMYLLSGTATYQSSWNEAYRFWLRSSLLGIIGFVASFFFYGLVYCLKRRCRIDLHVKQVLVIVTGTVLFGGLGSLLLLRPRPIASFTVALFDLLQMIFLLLLVMGNLVVLIGLIGRFVEALRSKNA